MASKRASTAERNRSPRAKRPTLVPVDRSRNVVGHRRVIAKPIKYFGCRIDAKASPGSVTWRDAHRGLPRGGLPRRDATAVMGRTRRIGRCRPRTPQPREVSPQWGVCAVPSGHTTAPRNIPNTGGIARSNRERRGHRTHSAMQNAVADSCRMHCMAILQRGHIGPDDSAASGGTSWLTRVSPGHTSLLTEASAREKIIGGPVDRLIRSQFGQQSGRCGHHAILA